MHIRERYFINAYGPDDPAFAALIAHALQVERRLGTVEKITFIGHGLQNDGWLERQFGADNVKKLKKGGARIQGSRAMANFKSLKTYKPTDNEILITLGLKSDDILRLDDNEGISAILALPWLRDDVEKWSRITGSIDFVNNTQAASFSLPPCEVTKALRELTATINMSTGLSHPNDNELAKTFLRALNKYNYQLDGTNIESYLIKDIGWQKENADELISIVEKINTGRSFQGGAKTHLKYHIDRWQKECAQ